MGLRVSKIEKSYFCDCFVAFSSFSLGYDAENALLNLIFYLP